jgi:SAM-dependent methyltransferase
VASYLVEAAEGGARVTSTFEMDASGFISLAEPLIAVAVAAVDPSPGFVAGMQARHPHLDVREAPAEHLLFDDDAFDVTHASLVVHFMSDPVRKDGRSDDDRVDEIGEDVLRVVELGRSPLRRRRARRRIAG